MRQVRPSLPSGQRGAAVCPTIGVKYYVVKAIFPVARSKLLRYGCPMGHETKALVAEIEACAKILGISTSTVTDRAGQGGRFYARLVAGKRAWPETIEAVRTRMTAMVSEFMAERGVMLVPDMADRPPRQGGEHSMTNQGEIE